MRDSVRAAFPAFTRRFESDIRVMYPDVEGLISTGPGFLLDSIPAASQLVWLHPDQRIATPVEVANEWRAVDALRARGKSGGGAFASSRPDALRCTDASVDRLFAAKLGAAECALLSAFPGWSTWPADAQLGSLSMSWAMGAAWPARWPRFDVAARAGNWAACVAPNPTTDRPECWMRETGENESFHERDCAGVLLFTNAREVVSRGLDPSVLYWPEDVSARAA